MSHLIRKSGGQLACSCGNPDPHEIAKRRTADNYGVVLWSDGAITSTFATNVVVFAKRSPEAIARALGVGWYFMDGVSLYEWDEIKSYYKQCEKKVQLA